MDIVVSAGMEAMSFSTISTCKENVQYSEIEKEITAFCPTYRIQLAHKQ